jgi:hypothetical protein
MRLGSVSASCVLSVLVRFSSKVILKKRRTREVHKVPCSVILFVSTAPIHTT